MSTWHDPVRAAARRAYVEGTETVIEIGRRLGVSESTIHRWRREEGWPPRTHHGRRCRRKPISVVARENLIPRLYGAISRNLTLLEKSMADDEAAPGGEERNTRAVGAMARTVEKLKELEAGTDHTTAAAAPKSGSATADLDETERLRLELAERILKLRERGKP